MNKITGKVIKQIDVLQTTDYKLFKKMPGNRAVDEDHVGRLINLMQDNGNLTDEFPVVVTANGYVIDGQHRIEALKKLKWPVGFVIFSTATIDTVRAINRGGRNWGWREIATSYADLGNEEYIWFLNFVKKYDLRFHTALKLTSTVTNSNGVLNIFNSGSFIVKDKVKSDLMGQRFKEIIDKIGGGASNDHALFRAVANIVGTPLYDHKRMLNKLSYKSHIMLERDTMEGHLRNLEKIYNADFTADKRERLF